MASAWMDDPVRRRLAWVILFRLLLDTILRRLFWEETVTRFEPLAPHFACTCSRERVGQMLQGLIGRDAAGWRLAVCVIAGFLPAAVLGGLFDKAIECSSDGKTITFHLNQPVGDFNYATTLGMSPVPAAVAQDAAEKQQISKIPKRDGAMGRSSKVRL